MIIENLIIRSTITTTSHITKIGHAFACCICHTDNLLNLNLIIN